MPRLFSLLGKAASAWSDDNATRLSAALAYYAIFSLAPLLVIVISAAGLIFGQEAARGSVALQMRELTGSQTAEAIQALVASTRSRQGSVVAVTLGFVVLLFGASGVFSELRSALNTIWGVQLKPGRALMGTILDKVLSLAMVLTVGFLLLISLVLSAVITASGNFIKVYLHVPDYQWHWTDALATLFVVTLLFALIFKMLPNVRVAWSDVLPAAVCTSILFTAGKFVIGFYLGTSGVTSSYGAAGSLVVILLWVYYNACILFYGAEFAKVYKLECGGGFVPDGRAERIGTARTPPGARASTPEPRR